MKTTAALIACLALALPVAAQTADDIASVTRQAQILEQVTESGDIGASLKLLPPTLLDRNAEAQGMSRAEFDAMMTESMAQLAGISKVRDSSIATRWMRRPASAPMPLNSDPTLPSRIRAVTRAGASTS